MIMKKSLNFQDDYNEIIDLNINYYKQIISKKKDNNSNNIEKRYIVYEYDIFGEFVYSDTDNYDTEKTVYESMKKIFHNTVYKTKEDAEIAIAEYKLGILENFKNSRTDLTKFLKSFKYVIDEIYVQI